MCNMYLDRLKFEIRIFFDNAAIKQNRNNETNSGFITFDRQISITTLSKSSSSLSEPIRCSTFGNVGRNCRVYLVFGSIVYWKRHNHIMFILPVKKVYRMIGIGQISWLCLTQHRIDAFTFSQQLCHWFFSQSDITQQPCSVHYTKHIKLDIYSKSKKE